MEEDEAQPTDKLLQGIELKESETSEAYTETKGRERVEEQEGGQEEKEQGEQFDPFSKTWFKRSVPVAFVLGIIVWVYYVFVYVVCLNILVENKLAWGFSYLIIFHIIVFMFLLSYMRCIFTDPGAASDRKTWQQNFRRAQQRGGSVERKNNGAIRYCTKCSVHKPDRCHHCRVCKRCILKMDHHCPWVNNCVGWGNQKYFLLFLFYTVLLSAFITFSLIPTLMKLHFNHKSWDEIKVLILEIMGVFFFLGLSGFGLLHFLYVKENITTIESFEKREKSRLRPIEDPERGSRQQPYVNPFDLQNGWKNLEQVFGNNYFLWLIPVNTTLGDGCTFPIRDDYCKTTKQQSNFLEESMESV